MTKAEKNKEYYESRKNAIKILVAYIKKNKEQLPDEVVETLKVFERKKGPKKNLAQEKFLSLIKKRKKINENDLFIELKIGRIEARNICNNLLKVEPEDRIWIAFDKEQGIYELKNEGPEMPVDWTGYIPQDLKEKAKNDIEIEDIDI